MGCDEEERWRKIVQDQILHQKNRRREKSLHPAVYGNIIIMIMIWYGKESRKRGRLGVGRDAMREKKREVKEGREAKKKRDEDDGRSIPIVA